MSTFKDVSTGSNSSIYLRLADGATKIRIVSDPLKIWVSFDRASKKAKKYLDEKIARDDAEAKPRWAFWCIDRTDGKFKMAEVGASIIKKIQVLALDGDFGFENIPPYDLKIMRTGSGLGTEYDVLQLPPSALTPDEQAHVVGLEKVETFMARQPGVVTSSEVVPF